jgi:hypothetical protein
VIRRTIATLAQKKGTIKDVQGVMRHSRAATTTDVYMQEIPASVQSTINSINSKLRKSDLSCNDGDALRLPGQGQKPVIARRVVPAHGGEVLVFIADEDGGPEVPVRLLIHRRDTQQHGPLIIDLHHGADDLGERRVEGRGKVQAHDFARFNQLVERLQDDAVGIGRTRFAIVEFLRWAEDAAYLGIGFKQR